MTQSKRERDDTRYQYDVLVVDALVEWYLECRSKGHDLFPTAVAEYQAQWNDRFARGLHYAWGKADTSTRKRMMRLAEKWVLSYTDPDEYSEAVNLILPARYTG